MRAREILVAESAGLHERDRERIAERERCGRAGGRCEIRAGTLPWRRSHTGARRLRRPARSRDCRSWRSASRPALDQRHDHQQLRAFSRIRQGDHDVLARDHAQVAVACFGGMDEKRRRPVLARVDAILRPMWPDLPIPQTTTRPRQPRMISIACTNADRAAPSAPRRRAPRCRGLRARDRAHTARAVRGCMRRVCAASWAVCRHRMTVASRSVPIARPLRGYSRRAHRAISHVHSLQLGIVAARCSGHRRGRVSQPEAAAAARLPGRRRRDRSARARPHSRYTGLACARGVRRRVPDVQHRAGIQPAEAGHHAPHRLRAGHGAGAGHRRASALWCCRCCCRSIGVAGWSLGGALAMSSTAILVKMLADRLELNSQHGRQIIGILLFQDLAVVPLLILVPALAQPARRARQRARRSRRSRRSSCLPCARVRAAADARLVPSGRPAQSSELFVLNVLLITLGLAYLTQLAGLSLALGAFLAGMLISETEYRYQVEDDIKPFRDVLLGLFFVTIGMQLDLACDRDESGLGRSSRSLRASVSRSLLIAALCRAVRERRRRGHAHRPRSRAGRRVRVGHCWRCPARRICMPRAGHAAGARPR